MNQNREAEACDRFGIESKTNDYLDGQSKAFSASDYTDLESVASIIERMMRPGKTIRCYRCFACNQHYAASKMTTALVLCRECLTATRDKGRIARLNVIDRITNDFRIFLRGRLEAK